VARLQTLLLDLDDTVYPASSGLWEAIGERINRFMIEVVGIDADQAPALRRLYFERYGTSLNGLRLHHGIDPFAYLRFVHDLPLEDHLSPDPRLRQMLQRLSIPPVIFTNADAAHARRVLDVLGVGDLIGEIIDIVALQWVNKPQPEAYRRALALCDQNDPRACLVVDDQVRNLVPAAALGMETVRVGPPERLDGVDHVIPRASDLLLAVPELARAPRPSMDTKG
jgi:putative hydrolase of the HAD superfamily